MVDHLELQLWIKSMMRIILYGANDTIQSDDPSGTYYLIPGDGLVNNGGITPIWHDHYAQNIRLRASSRIPK